MLLPLGLLGSSQALKVAIRSNQISLNIFPDKKGLLLAARERRRLQRTAPNGERIEQDLHRRGATDGATAKKSIAQMMCGAQAPRPSLTFYDSRVSLLWLSKRPGLTVQQDMSGTLTMMLCQQCYVMNSLLSCPLLGVPGMQGPRT